MIVFDLLCAEGHRFEGWFGSSDDFARQKDSGLLSCPQCGCAAVAKAPMSPAVPRKGNQRDSTPPPRAMANAPMPPEVREALQKLAEAQARALENSTWVGKRFVEDARAMHYGERDAAAIHGEASLEEARQLLEEGVPIAPLPFPVAPPDEVN